MKISNIVKYPILSSLAIVGLLTNSLAQAGDSGVIETEYYRAKNGSVDSKTFIGWSIYHNTCVLCHDVGGTGSVGPDLTVAVEKMTAEEFQTKVTTRYLIQITPDEMSSESGTAVRDLFLAEIQKQQQRPYDELDMPKWKHNPVVRDNIMGLYSYLKARADGVIGPKRPGLLKE